MYDKEVLNDLKDLLEGDFEELIEVYLRDLKTKVPEMEQHAHDQNYASLSKVAHSLKGASINLGIGPFGEQCGLIEQAARKQASDDIARLVPVAVTQSLNLITEFTSTYLK